MKNIFKTISNLFTSAPVEKPADVPEPQARSTPSVFAPQQARRYLAFDLEIAKVVPGDFSGWKHHRPLGICCAATMLAGQEPRLWYSRTAGGRFAPKMSRQDVNQLVQFLYQAVREGWQIVTWNGLSFDFDVLAEESDRPDLCINLAMDHTDMMFHFLCLTGYLVSLDKAARGMGLPGKMANMTGDLAPALWQSGQHQTVLDYNAQDVRATLGLANACDSARKLTWYTMSGAHREINLPNGWLTVNEVKDFPRPDTSWMSQPLRREEMYAWITGFENRYYDARSDWNLPQVQPIPTYPNHPNHTTPVYEEPPELSADEINAIFCDDELYGYDVPLAQPEEPPLTLVPFSQSIAGICVCPVCRGAPQEDFMFKQLYEEGAGEYWDRDVDGSWDDDWDSDDD